MAVSLSLPILFFVGLLISAALMWLNVGGVGVVPSAGVLLLSCVVVAVLQVYRMGSAGSILQATRIWILFVFLPAVAVLAVSRLPLLKAKPLLLLLLGPTSFLIAVVAVATVLNLVFASRHSR